MNDIDRQTIFSGVLRVLMKERKMDEKVLSKAAGITLLSVKNYAAGKALPMIPVLCRLADFFAVTPDQLLGYRKLTEEQLPPPPPPEPRRMKNNELAASFRQQLRENGKTLADYKEISAALHSGIYKNTKI